MAMDRQAWADALAQESQETLQVEAVTGSKLLIGCPGDGPLSFARQLMDAGRAFVLVARSLPSAVRLCQELAPQDADLLTRAAQMQAEPAKVCLFRSHEKPSARRVLLSAQAEGRVLGLVVTPDDLAPAVAVSELCKGGAKNLVWLVEDAHRLSITSSDHVPALAALREVEAFAARLFFTDIQTPEVAQHLGDLLDFAVADVIVGPAFAASTVEMKSATGVSATSSREALTDVLGRFLPREGSGKAVVVTPSHSRKDDEGLSTSEVLSVGEELGLHAFTDPGEEVGADASQWLSVLRQDPLFLLTDDAEAMSVLPHNSQPVLLRMVAPSGPDVLLQELMSLSRRGGGSWIYAGNNELLGEDKWDSASILENLGPWLATQGGRQPVSINVAKLARQWDIDSEVSTELLAQELIRLGELGLFASVRSVRLDLKVADASRFRRPFVDVDARFVALYERYQEVLGEMSMADSIRFRLESREPHDLRDWARLLSYEVHALNGLFDDMAREGVVVARQIVQGGSKNVNLELVPAQSWEHCAQSLEAVVTALGSWHEQALLKRQLVAHVLGAEDARGALNQVLSEGLGNIQLPEVQAVHHTPEVPAVPVESLSAELLGHDASDTESVDGAGDPIESVAPEPEAINPLAEVIALDGAGAPLSFPPCFEAFSALISGEADAAQLSEGLYGQVIQLLMGVWEGESEKAVIQLITMLKGGATLPAAQLVARTEFLITDLDGQAISDVPEAILSAALHFPLIEGLDGPTAAKQLASVLPEGTLKPGSFGSGEASLDGRVYQLQRRGAAPEIEAELWLGLLEAGDPISDELRNARLAEAYLAMAGLGEEALTRRLADYLVSADDKVSPVMQVERWAFARAQALLECERVEEAVQAMSEAEPPLGMENEFCNVLAKLSVQVSQSEKALSWALEREQAHPGTFGKMVANLRAALEGDDSGVSIDALVEAFQVGTENLWFFLENNPFSEPNAALIGRVVAAADQGWSPKDIGEALRLVENLGWTWPEGFLSAWFENLEVGEPEQWLRFATLALEHENEALAQAINVRPDFAELPEFSELRARLFLGQSDWKATLEATLEWPLKRVLAFLNHLAADSWLPGIAELRGSAEADSPLAERVSALVEESERSEKIAQGAAALQTAIDTRKWSEILPALSAYEQLMGERRDGLLGHAQRRRRDRVEHLLKLARGLRRTALERLRVENLERLQGDGKLFELNEVVEKTQEALDALAKKAAEAQAQREARSARESAGQREGTGRVNQARPSHNGGASDGRAPQRTQNQRPNNARSNSPMDRVLKGPIAEVEGRLRAALDEAKTDRDRVGLLLEGLRFMCKKKQTEAGLKVLRDYLDKFERVQALDGGLARLVEKGLPADEHLPRLRRVLEKVSGRFRYTIEAVTGRDNPEPWKQILGQLKLKA